MRNTQQRLSPLFRVGFGFILGLFIVAALSAPSVELVLPADGDKAIPATARIQIAFNQPMDTASLVSHFEVSPEIEGRFYWESGNFIFQPDSPWPSGEQIEITLQSGARSQRMIPLLRDKQWQFTVGFPRLVYLWPTDGKADLYSQDLDPEAARKQLTQSTSGVEDFTVSPDGGHIAYTAVSGDGGTSLHILDLIDESDRIILECDPDAPCRAPTFSPDGRWLAFEEHHFEEGAAGRLELAGRKIGLATIDQTIVRVLLDLQGHDVWGPSWSPSGLLTYYDEILKAVAIMDVSDIDDPQVLRFIPNGLGLMGTWFPDGGSFVIPEIVFADSPGTNEGGEEGEGEDVFYSHLYRVELESGQTVDISPGEVVQVEDSAPTFHPQGHQLAFTRKYLEEEAWTPGRQIWLLDVTTQRASSLTINPNLNYSALYWSPEGDKLAYMRRSFGDLNVDPEIGWLDIESGEETTLIQSGFLPAWIP